MYQHIDKLKILEIIASSGAVVVLFLSWKIWIELAELARKAQRNRGTLLRKRSLSANEWSRVTGEFLSWPPVKYSVLIGMGEVILLGYAFRKLNKFIALVSVGIGSEIIINIPPYLLVLWLFFRYGKYHLTQLDPKEKIMRKILLWITIAVYWAPIAGTAIYLNLIRR